jgi:hypothetical protein
MTALLAEARACLALAERRRDPRLRAYWTGYLLGAMAVSA